MKEHPRVVVVGSGFGGLQAVQALARSGAVEVLLLDRNNYHTFFPLLYQVAAAELEPEDIIYPVRSILRRRGGVRILMEEVTGIEAGKRVVRTEHHAFPYDYLVLGTGSTSHFFGVEGAPEHAFQLKSLEAAVALRNHILLRFERALCETDPEKRRQMLTFAVVGGGPTGVEFSGALAELVRGPLARDFTELDLGEVRLLLLEATGHLLPDLPPRLQAYALERLQKMGVDVRLGTPVTRITPESVALKDGTVIPLETVVWTAGVRGAPPAEVGDLPAMRNGRINVHPTLQVAGHPEVYAIGDIAHVEDGGQPVPMVAPVAVQEGDWAAHNILRQTRGLEPEPFHYHDPGTLATLGRNAAVVRLGKRTFTGFPAWVLWVGVHIFRLIGFRNRLMVLINWAWDYFFFERGVRLILPLPRER